MKFTLGLQNRIRIALYATSLLGCALAASAQTATLSLSPASGSKGSTINLPLTYASNGAQAAGLQWTLSFSPTDFSSLSVAAGPSASGAAKTISCNSPSSGQYICLASGMNANTIADGTVATASVTVSSATTATSSAIQLLNTVATSGPGLVVAASGSGTTVTFGSVPASMNTFSCSPSSLTAPGSSLCTVTLSAPAPSGGTTVSVGWTSTAATVSAPTSVAVPAGATSAQFTVQISAATSSTAVQMSASLNSATLTSTINVATAPTVAVVVSPASVALVASGTQQFTATVSGTSNTAVTWSLSSAMGSISSTGMYTAPSAITTQQSVTVRATSVADATKYATANVSINPPSAVTTGLSFWPAIATPATASASDTSAVELGLNFSSSVAGTITGVRFYKGSKNTGTHVGHLWTSTGSLLASVTFANETSAGWQQATFSSPVQISANTVYVVSYFAPNGGYADNQNYAWSNLSAAPLSVSGSSPGVYAYGSTSSFPKSTWMASNYWVDFVFNPTSVPSIAVSVSPSTATLAQGATQQFTSTVSGTSNTAVTWSLSSSVGSISTTGLYAAPASVTAQQTVTVRATSAADMTKYATATVIVNPPGTSGPVSFWPATAIPGTASDSDTGSVELGLKFSANVAGTVTGVRFYKGASNTGTHVGHLWTSSGTLLGSVTFTNETASGWQQASFATPVSVNANTVYVISYFAPNGGYADDQNYGWGNLSSLPLSVSGTTPGVYGYGSTGTFPSNTWNGSNYWVDVIFKPAQ